MAVSNALWRYVVERDAKWIWDVYGYGISVTAGFGANYFYWRTRQPFICIVPHIDPENRYPCGGRQEVDHVKDAPMLGRRAPDDAGHLVAMCQNHNTWHPPSKRLRMAEREYLKRAAAPARA